MDRVLNFVIADVKCAEAMVLSVEMSMYSCCY